MASSFFSDMISRVLDMFGSGDAEADKKRFLRKVSKSLSQTKIKYYKFSSDEALPQLAKFFFELYKVVGPAQAIFRNIKNPNAFKNMVINHYLTDEQKDIELRLGEEAIYEMSKKLPVKELTEHVNRDLSTYLSVFNEDKIAMIDMTYARLIEFVDFCSFDYYFFLKKFDPSIQEDNFTYVPRFTPIRAEYVLEDLKEFIDVAWRIQFDANWSHVFALLKESLSMQSITPSLWNKVLQRLRKLNSLGVFEMIIQLIAKDPGYQAVINESTHNVIDAQISAIKNGAEKALNKIKLEQKSSKIEDLLSAIFGTSNVIRLKYYSDETTQMLQKKSLSGYEYSAPLNYLKAFLNDYYKKNVREFADLVLIRGQWVSSNLAAPMSETYHQLLNLSEKITAFDENLSEEGVSGAKIKMYFARADRDREAKNILKTIIRDTNEEAQTMLIDATKSFIVVAKHTKMLLEDLEKKKPELIINWAELVHFAEKPIKEQGVDVYKKIFHFVTLMKFFLSKEEDA